MSQVNFLEHIYTQPDAVARMIALSPRIPQLDPARPLIFTGIGTSLHAARVAAAWVEILTQGKQRAFARDAHDLAMTGAIQPEDQIVVISHRGTKRHPNAVLAHAKAVGAFTVAISGEGVQPAADVLLTTIPQERASTHTISYSAALTVLAQLVANYVGEAGEPLLAALDSAPELMRTTLKLPVSPDVVDEISAEGATPSIIAGTGLDAITAAEVALKIKEGTYLWYEGMHTEVTLHGTPAVFRPGMTAIIIAPGLGSDGGRTNDLLGFLDRLGAKAIICGSSDNANLRFVDCDPLIRPFVVQLPFHKLVSLLSERVGSSPDTTHLDTEPWKSAFFHGISL